MTLDRASGEAEGECFVPGVVLEPILELGWMRSHGRHAEIAPQNPSVVRKLETFPGENRLSVRVRPENSGPSVQSGGQGMEKSGPL